jgi:hypothetical protein
MFVEEDPVKGGRKWKTLSKGRVPERGGETDVRKAIIGYGVG